MKKILLLFTSLFIITASNSFAQTVSITGNASSSQLNVFGNAEHHVSEHVYTDAEIGANFLTPATAINRVEFNVTVVGAPTSYNNVNIYLQNTATSTFTAGPYTTTGYTLVYSGNVNITSTGWAGVNLTTPFTRTAGSNLSLLMERTDGIARTALFTFASANGNNTSSTAATGRRYNGAAAPVSGTTSLSTSSFRAAIQLKHVVANDALVSLQYTKGKLPVAAVGGPQQDSAIITNNGSNTLTNLLVTLTMTGANTFTNSKTIATLAPNASTVVKFDPYSVTNAGSNVVTVSVPADDDVSNNSKSTNQTATTNAISYADQSAPNSSIGYNTGAGFLLNRYTLPSAIGITEVRVSVSSGTVGNTIYGVLTDASGTIISQSPDYVVVAGDANNYVTLAFPSAQNMPANTPFLIGIAQKANATTGYFPLNTQNETPGRTGAYYGISGLAGGAPTEYTTLGRFMIEAVFNSVLPVKLSTFTGKLSGEDAILNWSTSTEVNNKGFEIQRSADGSDFTTIGFVVKNYQFSDRKIALGNHFYRLKQIDQDGRFEYSDIVKLNKTAKSNFEVIVINPSKNKVSLQVNSETAERVSINLYNMNGQLVATKNTEISAGSNSLSIGENLSKGSYIVTIVKKGDASSYKVMVD
jgi:hypothetical protein